jgi:2-keto-3-deoxy-L-rhamnonate aldolase RhmA
MNNGFGMDNGGSPLNRPIGETTMLARNAVKHAAATGNVIRGIHMTFAAPTVVEVVASERLDFVYIDGEHGCFDWRDIEAMCIVAERHGMTPIARVPDRSSATITRFLDRGVRGIVVPHVESVDDAQRVIEAAYFAPMGERSFGAGRPEYWENAGERTAYMAACNDAVSICMMIESTAGLAHADRIAQVPGVDYLSFGMLDLAQSMGHPGNSSHPEVKQAAADCTARINKAGKRVREDFMRYVWVNDVLRAGMRALLDGASGAVAHSA